MAAERLCELLSANDPENRAKWALQAKKQGRKVIGIGCSHVPEELVHAAGLLPWRLTGTWQPRLDLVDFYRPIAFTEPYVNHVLESALKGDYSFLDGMITTNWDEDRRQLYDLWSYVKVTPLVFLIHLPRLDGELSLQEFVYHFTRLKKALEEFAGTKITDASLWESIRLYDRWRSLMMDIYDMRKDDEPPLSGGEALRLSEASFAIPKEELVSALEALRPGLANRRAGVSAKRPRLLVTGDMLDNPEYLDVVESEGALVAMDDLEAGSRYFWKTVGTGDDPLEALARRYLGRVPGPRFFFWDKKGIDQLLDWVSQYRIDAVLNLPLRDSFHRLYTRPYLTKRLNEAGIKNITLEVEYHLEMVGQFRTRVGAFFETLREW